MAGFYLILEPTPDTRIRRAAEHLAVDGDHAEVIRESLLSMAWVSPDDLGRYAPAHDPATGVRVLVSGRIAWNEGAWRKAEDLVEMQGGLSPRLMLQAYLEAGTAAIERHNGPAALIVWDPRDLRVHLFTDHFGYYPVYVRQVGGVIGTVISSVPDVIAADDRVSVSFDELSVAELLHNWRVTPPNTYLREVKHAGPAFHWTFDLGRREITKREYWRPFCGDLDTSLEDSADRLASAVKEAIRIRTLPELGQTTAFVSGGLDSRALLFGCSDPDAVFGVNLYDQKNKEAEVAEALCAAAHVPYVGVARRHDYYAQHLSDWVRLGGGMTSAEDNHFVGMRKLVRSLGARTVMTACTTDWIFKGYGLEKRYHRIAGRNLPLLALTDERQMAFLPNGRSPAPAALNDALTERLVAWFDGTPTKLLTERDRLIVEDRRVRPSCYAPSVSGQIMYRMYPYDTFLADRAVVDCYASTPASWKLNSVIWSLAMRRLCSPAREIVDSNFGWRMGATTREKLIAFGQGWVSRRAFRGRKLTPPATEGSWPDLGYVILNSGTFRDCWESTPQHLRAEIGRLWGSNPWSQPLEFWSREPNRAFKILTARFVYEFVSGKRQHEG